MIIPHRTLLVPMVLAAVCCVVGACSDKGEGARVASPGGAVVIGYLSEPSTLNPIAATASRERYIIDLLFKKLMVEEADFVSFRPGLAESWTFSADSLTVVFRLREGVTWQDGPPVTSADVRYTWSLQANPDAAWPGRSSKDRITDVEVIDDRTVAFHFASRYPYQLMDINDGPIVPKHLLEAVVPADMRTAAFGRSPVGNGPYRLVRWEAGQFIELARNPDYYEKGLPLLDRVLFRFVPDWTALVTQLKADEIDCLESLSPDAVADLRDNYPKVRIHQYKGREMSFVAWNLQRPLFSDRALRRAIAMGIDAHALIEGVWSGMAEPSTSPMHPILWAHDRSMQPIPFDRDGARRALGELGWRDTDGDGVLDRGGRPLEFEIVTNQGAQERVDAITILQAQLRAIGVDVHLRVLEWGTFMSKVVREGDFDACMFGYNVSTKADLKNYWATGAMFNLSRYSDAEVDTLIERARRTTDMEEARDLWFRCQRRIYDDQPHYFLAIPFEVVGLHKRFCNVHPNAQGFFVNLHEWYIGEDCR